MEFIQSTLFSNVIAFMALVTGLYSIYYTRSQNQYGFFISDFGIHSIGEYVELNIVIANDSPKPHFLKKIEFLDEKKNSIPSIELKESESEYLDDGTFNPGFFNRSLKINSFPGKLSKPEAMLPYAALEFVYHFEVLPKYIKLESNQRISKFKKYKLFSTDPYKHD